MFTFPNKKFSGYYNFLLFLLKLFVSFQFSKTWKQNWCETTSNDRNLSEKKSNHRNGKFGENVSTNFLKTRKENFRFDGSEENSRMSSGFFDDDLNLYFQ
jgi:hypothetical protein